MAVDTVCSDPNGVGRFSRSSYSFKAQILGDGNTNTRDRVRVGTPFQTALERGFLESLGHEGVGGR